MEKSSTKKTAAKEHAFAALYIRVSTDAQYEEGYSVEAQQERLEAYAKAIGIKNYEFYIDGGYTGSNLERPEIQRLVADAKSSRITHVIVYKLDRISRSQRDTLYLIEDVFLTHGVAFISINESFDTSTPFGRAIVGILSVFAQLERENIFERTRMGMLKRVERGLWMGGGRVPYGYDYDKEQGVLVPNADAENVRRIYDLYLQGYSLQRISDMLGLKYEKLAQQIMCRKSNAGYIVYNGREYKGRHEAIVSEKTYERAMMQLRERSLKKYVSSTDHLLTGLIRCGKCGAGMRYQKWGKKGYKFVCYSQQKSKPYLIKDPDCDNGRVWAEDVESEVVAAIMDISLQLDDDTSGQSGTEILDKLKKQYDTAAKKLKRLYNLYAESGDKVLLETIDDNKAELERLMGQIKLEGDMGVYSDSVKLARENIKDISDLWGFMTVQEKRNILRSVIQEIVISDDVVDIKFVFG